MVHVSPSRFRFVAGFLSASLLFGVSAVAVNVNNTPEGGYLLCYNTATKAVTFPGTLKCPKGTRPLELGAEGQPGQDGIDGSNGLTGPMGPQGPAGPTGPQGPTGPAGASASSNVYYKKIDALDFVAEGNITSGSQMPKKILAIIGDSTLPYGFNKLVAHISGSWANSASSGDIVDCFFQNDSDYLSNSSFSRWGASSTSYNSWNYFDFSVWGDSWVLPGDTGALYLVCKTSGTITNLRGWIEVFNYKSSLPLGTTRPSVGALVFDYGEDLRQKN